MGVLLVLFHWAQCCTQWQGHVSATSPQRLLVSSRTTEEVSHCTPCRQLSSRCFPLWGPWGTRIVKPRLLRHQLCSQAMPAYEQQSLSCLASLSMGSKHKRLWDDSLEIQAPGKVCLLGFFFSLQNSPTSMIFSLLYNAAQIQKYKYFSTYRDQKSSRLSEQHY